MRVLPFLRGLGCLLPLLAQACASPSSSENESPCEPVRWVLVEKRYGDLADPPLLGDGRVNPDALVLAFQPLYPEDLDWNVTIEPEEHYAQVLACSPQGPARPGEIVTAIVRVGNPEAGRRYQLRARPSRSEVRILSESQIFVRGNETAIFRFTSGTSGRAGITISAESVGGSE